jgi:hypothetical protein
VIQATVKYRYTIYTNSSLRTIDIAEVAKRATPLYVISSMSTVHLVVGILIPSGTYQVSLMKVVTVVMAIGASMIATYSTGF